MIGQSQRDGGLGGGALSSIREMPDFDRKKESGNVLNRPLTIEKICQGKITLKGFSNL